MLKRPPTTAKIAADRTTFGLLAAATASVAIALGVILVIAIGDGAIPHAIGLLTKLCVDVAQFAAGTAALSLLLLPALILLGLVFHATRIHVATRMYFDSLGSTNAATSPRLMRAATQAGLDQRVELVHSDELIACAHGLRNPRVLISTGAIQLLTDGELLALLRHEAHHVSRRDPLRMFAAEVSSRSLFMLPIIGDLKRHFMASTELAADRRALAHGRAGIASALMKFLDAPRPVAIPCIAPQAKNDIRIEHLLHPESFQHRLRITRANTLRTTASCALVISLVAVLAALPPTM